MRNIVIDSSSVILLYKCGAAEILLHNCCCIIPDSVRCELEAPGRPGAEYFSLCISAGILTVAEVSPLHTVMSKMGAGERGVISLFNSGIGDYIIMDDGKGAAYCRKSGIPYINALLAVKIIFFKGIITGEEMGKMFSWVKKNGRYSDAVIQWAERADAAILDRFLL